MSATTYVGSGYGPGHYISAAGANCDSTVIKNAAGVLGLLALYNFATSVRFVKLYDKATAPTSADTPVATLAIPAAAASSAGGSNLPVSPGGGNYAGLGFAVGISFRITTGLADNDNNAASANDVVVNWGVG